MLARIYLTESMLFDWKHVKACLDAWKVHRQLMSSGHDPQAHSRSRSHSYIYIYIYSTICRHACFGVLYASSVQLGTHLDTRWLSYWYTWHLLSQAHVVQHGPSTCASRHAQNDMGLECSNNHEGSELCIIANGHPINSTECSTTPKWRSVVDNSTICRHACFGDLRLYKRCQLLLRRASTWFFARSWPVILGFLI
jgi:hypothetical protein